MPLRTLALKAHRWIGLATGLVLTVVCLTGAILVFEDEIIQALHPERYEVAVGARRVTLEAAAAAVRQAVPGAEVTSVTVRQDPTRPYELLDGRERAFVDPYTGTVLATGITRPPFFTAAFGLHRWMLAGDVGKMIVGVSTLLFLVILVSGVIIWWPRNRAKLRARATVTALVARGTRWKRRNHDLHVVLGIYTAPVLFVLAFTGLAWSFEWFNDGIYTVTRSAKAPSAPESAAPSDGVRGTLDQALTHARMIIGPAEFYTVRLPSTAVGAVAVTALPVTAVHNRATDAVYFDRATGALLRHDRFSEASLGVRVRRTFYPVHVGSIWGMPSRIVAFVVCLLGASFPITGFILWLPKWWRGRTDRRRGVSATAAGPDEARPVVERGVPA